MRWKYRESGAKVTYLLGLSITAFLAFLCPAGELVEKIYGQFFSTAAFCMDALAYGEESVSAEGRVMDAVAKELPLYSYSISYFGDGMMNQYYKEYVEILMQEAKEGTNPEMTENGVLGQETPPGQDTENGGETGAEREQESGDSEAAGLPEDGGGGEREHPGELVEREETAERLNEEDSYFVITDGSPPAIDAAGYQDLIHSEKVQNISLEDYREFEALVGKFYTVDASTYTTAEELNGEKLAAADMKLERGEGGPQILIYHTHAHEGYADSVEGDPSTTVVGVGEQLAEILRSEYGYEVMQGLALFANILQVVLAVGHNTIPTLEVSFFVWVIFQGTLSNYESSTFHRTPARSSFLLLSEFLPHRLLHSDDAQSLGVAEYLHTIEMF